jgi:hypothetical protein
MTEKNKIFDFFNNKSTDSTNGKKRKFSDSKRRVKEEDDVEDLFSDVDWGHPEPEDKNSYEYAKYIANLLLRNGVDVEISQRDKKKIMEYILSDSKKEPVE